LILAGAFAWGLRPRSVASDATITVDPSRDLSAAFGHRADDA
jgi:hypothetical protein